MDLIEIDKAFNPKALAPKVLSGPLLGKTTVVRTPARLGTRTKLTTTHEPGLVPRLRGRKPNTTTELENTWYDYGARVRQKKYRGIYT